MLILKIIFLFCGTTIYWRKMQITERLSLNETSQKKKIKQRPTPMLWYNTNNDQRRNNGITNNNSWNIIQ